MRKKVSILLCIIILSLSLIYCHSSNPFNPNRVKKIVIYKYDKVGNDEKTGHKRWIFEDEDKEQIAIIMDILKNVEKTSDKVKKVPSKYSENLDDFNYAINIFYDNGKGIGYDLLLKDDKEKPIIHVGFDFYYLNDDDTAKLKELFK